MLISCPLCAGSVKLKYDLGAKIYQCVHCKLYFAVDIKYNSDKVNDLNINAWFDNIQSLRAKNFLIITTKIKSLKIGKNGLEVGSSRGLFLEISHNNSINCVGIEPEEEAYQYALAKNLVVHKGFFPQNLPTNINNLDFIIFNDVFEHIPNIKETLSSSIKLLTSDGTLILNLPLSSGFFYKLSDFLAYFKIYSLLRRLWQLDFYTPHVYYHDKKSIQAICNLYDMELIDYHKLDVISKHDISHRINIDPFLSKFHFILLPFLKIFLPIINHFNEDVGVFYLRKKNKNLS